MKYCFLVCMFLLVGCGTNNEPPQEPSDAFQIKRDGFSFANYGRNRSVVNLTNESVSQLCQVPCLRGKGDSCVISTPLESFLEFANRQMDEGHCYGISVLSGAIFNGSIPLASLDGLAQSTYELPLSIPVQRVLAYYSAAQFANPSKAAAMKNLTPNQVLELLRNPSNELYMLAIYEPNFKNGHAVLALAVLDDSTASSRIAVYDSNYPGNSQRFINVNRVANTWSYGAYTSLPDVNTLIPIPLSVPLLPQTCPVAGRADTAGSATLSDWQVLLIGEGDITNLPNTTLQIPVVSEAQNDDNPEPIHMLPAGQEYVMNIDGSLLSHTSPSSLYFHRAGHSIRIQDILLDKGQVDTVKLGADGASLTYYSTDKELITIRLGASYQDVDYELVLQPSGHVGGTETEVINEIDPSTGQHALRVRHKSAHFEPAFFRINILRRSSIEDSEFENSMPIAISNNECIHINYGVWRSTGEALRLVRDTGCDGLELQIIALPDDV